MGFHWRYGVVEGGAGPSAPASMIIEDDDGTPASITYQIDSGSATDLAHDVCVVVATGEVFKIDARSDHTGDAPTSWSWVLAEDSGNVSHTITAGTTTNQNYTDSGSGPYITMGSVGSRQSSEFTLRVSGTNSGGTTHSTVFEFTLAEACR